MLKEPGCTAKPGHMPLASIAAGGGCCGFAVAAASVLCPALLSATSCLWVLLESAACLSTPPGEAVLCNKGCCGEESVYRPLEEDVA